MRRILVVLLVIGLLCGGSFLLTQEGPSVYKVKRQIAELQNVAKTLQEDMAAVEKALDEKIAELVSCKVPKHDTDAEEEKIKDFENRLNKLKEAVNKIEEDIDKKINELNKERDDKEKEREDKENKLEDLKAEQRQKKYDLAKKVREEKKLNKKFNLLKDHQKEELRIAHYGPIKDLEINMYDDLVELGEKWEKAESDLFKKHWESEMKRIKEWYEEEIKKKMEACVKIEKKFGIEGLYKLMEEIKKLRARIDQLASEITYLESDIKIIKNYIKLLEKEVKEFTAAKSDLSLIKAEIEGLGVELAILKGKIAHIKKLNRLKKENKKKEIADEAEKFKKWKKAMKELKEKLKNITKKQYKEKKDLSDEIKKLKEKLKRLKEQFKEKDKEKKEQKPPGAPPSRAHWTIEIAGIYCSTNMSEMNDYIRWINDGFSADIDEITSATGLSFSVTYQVSAVIGVSFSYEHLSTSTDGALMNPYPPPNTLSHTQRISVDGFLGLVTLKIPENIDKFDVMGIAGMGVYRAKYKETENGYAINGTGSGFGYKFGVVFNYFFTEKFGICSEVSFRGIKIDEFEDSGGEVLKYVPTYADEVIKADLSGFGLSAGIFFKF